MGHRTTKTNHKVKVHKTVSYRIDFFYYAFRNVLLVSIPLLVVCSVVLSHLSFHSSATGSNSGVDQIQFSLSTSCTMSSVVDEAHTKEINNGTYHSDVGKTTITTLCNDGNGYSVYAVGYSNNEEGNNKLINTDPSYSNHSIETGLNTSGLTSAWAMKLNNIPDDPSPTPPTIESDYNNTYGLVPSYWTKVASRASGTTDMAQGSSFTTTYAVYASSSQYAGTYSGQVKYLLTHPSTQVVAYYMQDVANWQNEIPNPGDTLLATDVRDNKEYWVTRLADGHIWMTQNLDFDIEANTTLNSQTTDLNVAYDASTNSYPEYRDGYTNNGGIIYWQPASSATTIDFTGTNVPGWSNQNNYPYSADPGDVYYYTSNSTSDDIKYTSLSACITAGHTEGECKHYHAGNYYNWTAAIASNSSSNLNTQYANAPNSVCPAGWRLPVATNADQSIYEFGELLYKQGITKTKTDQGMGISYTTNGFYNIRKSPLWFIRGGQINNGTLSSASVNGLYLSGTIRNDSAAYAISFTNAAVWPAGGNDNSKSLGRFLRCLAR